MTTIYCINCDQSREVEIKQIRNGQFLTCEKCDQVFNLFGIYNFIYNAVPLAKKIVDTLTSAVYGKFHFLGEESDLKKINQFCKASEFDSLVSDICFDTVLFGNAFIEKISEDEGFLRRLDLKSIEIITSWQRTPPFKGYSEEIDKLMQYNPTRREIPRSNFFHFLGEVLLPEPVGSSVLGFWFDHWYRIVFSKKSQTRSLIESGVIGASGVPHYLIFPKEKYPNDFKKKELGRFLVDVKHRREHISRVVEREVLPLVLGRPFDHKQYPKLEFI